MSSANIEKRCAAKFLEAVFGIPEDYRCRSCNCRLTSACCRTGFPLRFKPAANASVRRTRKMNAAYKVFTDCSAKVAKRYFSTIGSEPSTLTITPYHKGGFLIAGAIPISAHNWPEVIFEALSAAQNVGRAWVITGNIDEELDAWSNDSVILGIFINTTTGHPCMRLTSRLNRSLRSLGRAKTRPLTKRLHTKPALRH